MPINAVKGPIFLKNVMERFRTVNHVFGVQFPPRIYDPNTRCVEGGNKTVGITSKRGFFVGKKAGGILKHSRSKLISECDSTL